jgi:hypothetical protein
MKLSEAMRRGWEIMLQRGFKQITSEFINNEGCCALGAAMLALRLDSTPSRFKRILLLRKEFPVLRTVTNNSTNSNNKYTLWDIIIMKNDNEGCSIPVIASWLEQQGL